MTSAIPQVQVEVAPQGIGVPYAPSGDFDAAWAAASADVGLVPMDHDARSTEPSALTTLASRQAEQLVEATAMPDLNALSSLSAVQAQVYSAHMTNKMNFRMAEFGITQAVVKNSRQSLDTLMNSK